MTASAPRPGARAVRRVDPAEDRLRVGARAAGDVAALGVGDHQQALRAGVGDGRLEREPAGEPEALEARELRLDRDARRARRRRSGRGSARAPPRPRRAGRARPPCPTSSAAERSTSRERHARAARATRPGRRPPSGHSCAGIGVDARGRPGTRARRPPPARRSPNGMAGRRFAGVRQSVARRRYLIAFLRPEPAVKRGTLLAAICIVSPVRGLRPSRAPRWATWNLPKPVNETSSPERSASSIDFDHRVDGRTGVLLGQAALSATLSTNSDFVMYSSFVPGRGRGGAKLTRAPDAVLALAPWIRPKSPQFARFSGAARSARYASKARWDAEIRRLGGGVEGRIGAARRGVGPAASGAPPRRAAPASAATRGAQVLRAPRRRSRSGRRPRRRHGRRAHGADDAVGADRLELGGVAAGVEQRARGGGERRRPGEQLAGARRARSRRARRPRARARSRAPARASGQAACGVRAE